MGDAASAAAVESVFGDVAWGGVCDAAETRGVKGIGDAAGMGDAALPVALETFGGLFSTVAVAASSLNRAGAAALWVLYLFRMEFNAGFPTRFSRNNSNSSLSQIYPASFNASRYFALS